jgi:hypothetical protein
VHRTSVDKYQRVIGRAAQLATRGEDGVQLGNTLLALQFAEDETFDVDTLIELDTRYGTLFRTERPEEAIGSAAVAEIG